MDKSTESFIQQTANDYDLTYLTVKEYYDKCFNQSSKLFYEKLEEHLKKKYKMKITRYETYTTLIHFYDIGKSEEWKLDHVPQNGSIINMNGTRKMVDYIEYNTEIINTRHVTNIFIYTKSIK